MKKHSVAWITVIVLTTSAGGATAQSGVFPVIQTETEFLDACEKEWVQRVPTAASWARDACQTKWQQAGHAAPMADAVLALAPETGGAAPDARASLLSVRWTSATEGMLGDLMVTLPASGRLSFHWEEQGSEGHYDLIQALRIRGVALESLGCPQYPMVSMGQEKVMVAKAEGRAPFVVTVYGRAAPTGMEYALYDVDADFSGTVPDGAALAAGQYPGGGGRAFAVDASGWTETCPDPGF